MAFRLLGLYTIFSVLISCAPVVSVMPELTATQKVAQGLITKQNIEFPRILKELQDNKKKTSHWIWWVFPSEKPGDSEPGVKTSVNLSNVDYVLSNADLAAWAEIMEEILKLLKLKPGFVPDQNIIPRIDHGRIHYALIFWLEKAKAKTQKHARFFNALSELRKYNWHLS